MTISLRYTALSDVGLIRRSNQDAGYASPNMLVLADGMGGAAGGDIASSVVVAHLAEIDDVHPAEDLLALLTDTLEKAHKELINRATEKTALAGLGTTCIAILRASNKLGMVHVGDSRAYLLRNAQLTQITRDHTLVQYLVDRGEITPEEAENHPKRNVIMKNIGDNPEPLELDKSIREALPGDRWLLTSDGLFGVVSKEMIAETLNKYSDLDQCAQQLVNLALAAGAPDNVTVVLADVTDNDEKIPTDRPMIVGSAAIDGKKPTRGGPSAAGKAAGLTRVPDSKSEDNPEEHRSRKRARFAVILALILLIGGGGGGAYAWSQTQYYVHPANGTIAIYKGVPSEIGPLKLSSIYERSDIEVDSLTPVAQARLSEPITRGSLEEARKVLGDLAAQKQEPTPEQEPTPDPTPSVFPDTQPSPSPSSTTSPELEGDPTPLPNTRTPTPDTGDNS